MVCKVAGEDKLHCKLFYFKKYSLPKKSKKDIINQQQLSQVTVAYTTATITPESREQKLINAALVAMPTIYNNEGCIRK